MHFFNGEKNDELLSQSNTSKQYDTLTDELTFMQLIKNKKIFHLGIQIILLIFLTYII